MAKYEKLSGENNRSDRQGSAERLGCIPCGDPGAVTTVMGCCNPNAYNFDANATCDDGSCLFSYGCTDWTASNYNALATNADGSCIWLGCLNPTSSNYMGYSVPYAGILPGPYFGSNEWGTAVDDGSCEGGSDWYVACTDPTATTNYDPNCISDPTCYSCFLNTCCIYPVPDVLGCTAPTADNYDALANVDDGSCFIYDCTTPTATNYSGYNTGDPYLFSNGVTGIVISDNTLCKFTFDPTNIDCTLQGAQIVAQNIIYDTGRWMGGSLGTLQAWVEMHWYYQPVGYIPPYSTPHPCKWFEKMVLKFTGQISDHFAGIPPSSTWGPNYLALNQAKLEYFQQMLSVCNCDGAPPLVDEPDCKTIIVDKDRYYKYEHDTDTTTPLIGIGAGTQSFHNPDQPWDIAMWGDKFYAIVEVLDANTSTMYWMIKEYLVNWTNNEFTFIRDIVANNAIQDIPWAYTMKDANTMLVMTGGSSSTTSNNQAIVEIDITTNIAPVGVNVIPILPPFVTNYTALGGDITYYDDDTILVSFNDSDEIWHYYLDTVNGYAGAGLNAQATVPNIYGVMGHYTFANETYIITVDNNNVEEVRQATPTPFPGAPVINVGPVLPNTIPIATWIRGADTGCAIDDPGGDALYNYRDSYGLANTNMMFTAVKTPGSCGSGGAPHDPHKHTWKEDVIGDDRLTISIADQDVLGNTYVPSDFDLSNNPGGYTITIYDNMKNFLGKWNYSHFQASTWTSPGHPFYRPNQPNILCKESMARVEYNAATGVDDIVGVAFPNNEPGLPGSIILRLRGVTHLAGPNPLVRYGSNSDQHLTQLASNGVALNDYEVDYELNTRGGHTSSYCFMKVECEATINNPFENIFTGPNTATNNTAAICTGRWWNFEPGSYNGIGESGGQPTNNVSLSSIAVPSPALLHGDASNFSIHPGYPRPRPLPARRLGGKVGVYLEGTYHSDYAPLNAYHTNLGHTNSYGLTNGWGWSSTGPIVSLTDIRNNWPYHYIHPWFASFPPSAALTSNGITWFPNVQLAISATASGIDQPCVTGTNSTGSSS